MVLPMCQLHHLVMMINANLCKLVSNVFFGGEKGILCSRASQYTTLITSINDIAMKFISNRQATKYLALLKPSGSKENSLYKPYKTQCVYIYIIRTQTCQKMVMSKNRGRNTEMYMRTLHFHH